MSLAHVTTAVVTAEKHFAGLRPHDLWVAPWVIGVCTYVVLLLLLALCFAFRSIGKRH